MIKRSMVAFIFFSVAAAACDDSPTLPRPDAARDTRVADSRIPDAVSQDARDAGVDAAVPDAPIPDGPIPDGGADGGLDVAAADSADASADTAQSLDLADAAPGPEAPMDTSPTPDAQPDTGIEAGVATDAATSDAAFGCEEISRDEACLGYCELIAIVCTGVNAQYPSVEACSTACLEPTLACGTPGALSGNSVSCRASYVAAALISPATLALSCVNAGPSSFACR